MSALKIFPIMLALMVGGCASAISSGYGQGGRDSYGRSYEAARADRLITADVTTALVRDREVPAMGITVTTYEGVVTLSGRVPSEILARRAVRIAGAVSRVVRVENRLTIGR